MQEFVQQIKGRKVAEEKVSFFESRKHYFSAQS